MARNIIKKMEFKNVPEEFLNMFLQLKAELKLEKINHGKCQSHVEELKDRIKTLELRCSDYRKDIISISGEKKHFEHMAKEFQNTIKQLKSKSNG